MKNIIKSRGVWAEINLDNLSNNFKEVKQFVGNKTMILAVVKGNSYGHGSVEVAKTFSENGVNKLAVSMLAEGIELRKGNIQLPILLLNYTPEYQLNKVVEYSLTQSICSFKDAKTLSEKAKSMDKNAVIHLKIDTGMDTTGFMPTEKTIKEIAEILDFSNIEVEGIFTHFATADKLDKSDTINQFIKFMWVVKELEAKGIQIPIKHVSNSAGIINFPEYNLDMVRAGIILYGYYPCEGVNKTGMTLKPAIALKANISNIKDVPKGTRLGYGKIFKTQRNSIIGALPIGYGDGFSRILTEKAHVSVKNMRVPIVGRISMDQVMIDLTDVKNVGIGVEAVLFGHESENHIPIEEVAKFLGTIISELTCMINRRVPRLYIKNGNIIKEINYLLQD